MKMVARLPFAIPAGALAMCAISIAATPACVAAVQASSQGLTCNVRDFGAVGDGVADDAPAITARLRNERVR